MVGLIRRAFGQVDPSAFARGAARMDALNTMQRENETRLGLQRFMPEQRNQDLDIPSAPEFNPSGFGSDQRVIEPPAVVNDQPNYLESSPNQYVPEQGPNVNTDDETGATTIEPAPTSLGTERLNNPDLITQQSTHLTVPDYNPSLGNAEGVNVGQVQQRVSRIRQNVATGNYDNGQGLMGSPFGQFLGWFTDDDAEAAVRDNAGEAIDWYNSEEGRNYFLQNPNALDLAERDPVGFYLTYKGEAGLRQERRTLEQSASRTDGLITNVSNAMAGFLNSPEAAVFVSEAQRLGVDPAAAIAIYGIETGFGANAGTSARGASGGMQVIDETFNSMKAWFTDPANIEQYNIPAALTTTARGLVRGDQMSELQAGLLVIKYNELIGNPKNLWGAGYQGNANSVLAQGRPLNANDGNITNYDYNRAYVELYNQVLGLAPVLGGSTATAQGSAVSSTGGNAGLTLPSNQSGVTTSGGAASLNQIPGQEVFTTLSGNTGNQGVATENLSSLQNVTSTTGGQTVVSGGGSAVGGGSAAEGSVTTPDIYLANPSRAGYEININNRNRTRVVEAINRTNTRIRDMQRVAEIYRAAGNMQKYQEQLSLIEQVRAQGTALTDQVLQYNDQMIYLQGMQGINDLTYGNNPNRLSMVWSQYAGRDVRIVPRTDGRYDLMIDGQMALEGATQLDIVQRAQLQFDSSYRQTMAQRNNLLFETQVETAAEIERKIADVLGEISVENAKTQGAILLEQAKARGITSITSLGNGKALINMGGVPYLFDPETEIPGIDGADPTYGPRLTPLAPNATGGLGQITGNPYLTPNVAGALNNGGSQ